MNTLLLYLVKSIFVSGLLTSWYWLGLRNKRLHRYNRFFLLATLAAGIVVPLLHFEWFNIGAKAGSAPAAARQLLQIVGGPAEAEISQGTISKTNLIDWPLLAQLAMAAISAVLLLLLLIRIVKLKQLSRRYERTDRDGIVLVMTDLERAPFSFFNCIFWRADIGVDSVSGKAIYEHELAHVKQLHTYDKIACQMLTCIFWMNPFYRIIQNELGIVHEFLADEAAISEHDTATLAMMLLATHNGGRYLTPEHQFFSSPIKRRLTMLQQNKTTRFSTLRKMTVLPLLAAAVLSFSFTTKTGAPVEKADHRLLVVLDAGHGGTDAGATYNDRSEKEFTLKVAKRMQELAPAYNIDARLTRDKDENMTLEDRVAFSNKLHPDCFISVHVSGRSINKVATKDVAVEIMEFSQNGKSKDVVKRTRQLAKSIYTTTQFMTSANEPAALSTDKPIYVLRNNDAPAIGLELGVIQNSQQMQRLQDPAKLDEVCNALLKGIVAASKN